MSLKLAVPKETAVFEERVAASPETVKKFIAQGFAVCVESEAGVGAAYTDNMYKEAGAQIVKTAKTAVQDADIVLHVQAPDEKELEHYGKNAVLIAMLAPYNNEKLLKKLAESGVTALSMKFVPRITRAQSMDVLSSQSNLAGYKAVLDATTHFKRALPMMMTAAGTIPPAKVFVMGTGVAGLQAIATARRLGAVVSATDVRLAAKEQVESLGASFVMVEDEETANAETSGGYAKEMSKAYQKKQAALVEETIAKQDIVITTALIPGRLAPVLITEKMVSSMKPGTVIVDLAVETGGNCVLSEAGQVVEKHGVTILGHRNVPGRLATDASALYARNLMNMVTLIASKDSGKLLLDPDDEIIKGVTLTRDGKIVHPLFSKEKETKKAPVKKAASKSTSQKKASTTAKKSTAKNKKVKGGDDS